MAKEEPMVRSPQVPPAPSPMAGELVVNVGETLTLTALDPATGAKAEVQLGVTRITVPDAPPQPIPPDPGGLLEKVYKPEDFGGDFTVMQSAILADQTTAGDNKMRAVVQLQRAKRYEYQKNNWLSGVQNYRCEATGSGANPVLFNANVNASYYIDRGPLNIGKGANCFVEPGYFGSSGSTSKGELIETVSAGSSVVKLLDSASAAKLKPGRWHTVYSYCQQIGGYPPNVRWIDYVKVESIEGSTVNLDRMLKHDHFADYWEDPNDEKSVGKARIGLWDGFYDDIRCTLSGHWKDIDFEGSGTTTGVADTTYIESHINCLFENCSISNFWPSMCKDVTCVNCKFTGAGTDVAEFDKMCDTITLDGMTTGNKYLTGGTGVTEMIIKNSHTCCINIGPRKLTVENSTIDAMGDSHYSAPCGWPFPGHKIEYSFTGTTFVADGAWAFWAWNSAPVDPLPLSSSSWSGKKLVIPRSFAKFESWVWWLYEGIMLFTGPSVRDPQKYGRVDKIYAPPDGSALWCDVTWISGAKPTSGNLNLPQKGLRKLVWGAGNQITKGGWTDPDFISMEGTPADRPFPQGIA